MNATRGLVPHAIHFEKAAGGKRLAAGPATFTGSLRRLVDGLLRVGNEGMQRVVHKRQAVVTNGGLRFYEHDCR